MKWRYVIVRSSSGYYMITSPLVEHWLFSGLVAVFWLIQKMPSYAYLYASRMSTSYFLLSLLLYSLTICSKAAPKSLGIGTHRLPRCSKWYLISLMSKEYITANDLGEHRKNVFLRFIITWAVFHQNTKWKHLKTIRNGRGVRGNLRYQIIL